MVMDFEGKEGYEFSLPPPPKKKNPSDLIGLAILQEGWTKMWKLCFSGYFMHGSFPFLCMNLGQSCESEKITFW